MEKAVGVIIFGMMLFLSVADIRSRKIPTTGLLLWGVVTIAYQGWMVWRGEIRIENVCLGAGVGILFLIISRITEEAIGYGDSVAITILGAYLGFWGILENLAGAFFISAIWSIWQVSIQKSKRSISFFPFLTTGYLFLLIEQGGAL